MTAVAPAGARLGTEVVTITGVAVYLGDALSAAKMSQPFMPGMRRSRSTKQTCSMRRFGKPPKSEHDAHRPLRPSNDLDEIFTWQEERKITGDLVVHYKRGMYLLEQTPEALKLRRKLVQVYEREDGTVTLKHKGVTLPFGKFDKDQRVRQGEIVDNKHLGAALAFAQAPAESETRKRWGREPSRAGGRSASVQTKLSARPPQIIGRVRLSPSTSRHELTSWALACPGGHPSGASEAEIVSEP